MGGEVSWKAGAVALEAEVVVRQGKRSGGKRREPSQAGFMARFRGAVS